MSQSLDFYFDFSSPYGYLASARIESLARRHQLTLRWHAIPIGFIFPLTGQKPLTEIPLIGEYTLHDVHRSAREHGIVYHHPQEFPVNTLAACRVFYWLKNLSANLIPTFSHAIYQAYFKDGLSIRQIDDVIYIAKQNEVYLAGMESAYDEPLVKDATKTAVDDAVEKGVFGSPFFILESGEAFWGNDRMDQLDRWLQNKGW